MSGDLVKAEGGALARLETLEAQFELFKRHGLAESMAERYRFAVDDETGGYKLVKRKRPISIYADETGVLRSVVQTQKTTAERVKLSATKGRYNDEWRLALSDVPTVEVGEVASWSVI